MILTGYVKSQFVSHDEIVHVGVSLLVVNDIQLLLVGDVGGMIPMVSLS